MSKAKLYTTSCACLYIDTYSFVNYERTYLQKYLERCVALEQNCPGVSC